MTREAFEAWVPTVAERWEWVRGFAIPVPHAFAGGTWAHARVTSRIFARLSAGLKPPCEPIIGDLMRLATPASQRYGDIYIVCEQIEPASTVLKNGACWSTSRRTTICRSSIVSLRSFTELKSRSSNYSKRNGFAPGADAFGFINDVST